MEDLKLLNVLENDIINSETLDEYEKNKILKNIFELKNKKINIMITGATGCGKSSTINALFGEEKAKVGVGVDPETMIISRFDLNNLVLWDSPGLGDGKEADIRHSKNIINKLLELDSNNDPLIDLVLVIIDGSTRDMGTSYELINNVIIPNLGENKSERVLIAINQADVAMKGKNWIHEENKPNEVLKNFLEEKVISIKKRVKEATGIDVEPIYYSAGYKEEGREQQPPYNLSKLLYYIVKSTPSEKRMIYTDNINREPEMWTYDDELIDYREETKNAIFDSIVSGAIKGSKVAKNLVGGIFGEDSIITKGAQVVGGIIGGALNFIGGLFS